MTTPEEIAMITMMLSSGIDPLGVGIPDYALGGAQMPYDASGDPDFQKTSDVKNQLSIMSDPAFLATFGGAGGGYRQQDFQPTMKYEPVQAPGFMRMQQYLNSSDPVSRYIAEVIADGGTANQAETELRQIANDPTNELYPEITPYIQSYDDQGQPMQDWNRVREIATSLEKDVLYDPQFNATDPKTGLPAWGEPEETEAMRYFRESGLPMPDERYGLETINPEKAPRNAEARSGIQASKQSAVTARGDRDRLRQEMLAMQKATLSGSLPVGDIASQVRQAVESASNGGLTPQRGGWADDLERLTQDPAAQLGSTLSRGWDVDTGDIGRRIESIFDPNKRTPPTTGTIGDLGLPPGQQITAPTGSPPPAFTAADLSRKMESEAVKAKKQQIMDASRRMLASQGDARDRNLGLGKYQGSAESLGERMLRNKLAQTGRTPLNDTLAARRQALARFGIQV